MSSKSPKVVQTMVELKARVDDLEIIRDKLIQFQAEQIGVFHQIDTYYEVCPGRLKLREVEGETDAELIYYERENIAEPKRSSILTLKIPQPHTFKPIIERVTRTKTVVDKVREIYFFGGIQIHLDTVKNLGSFVEFELVTSQDSEQQKTDLSRLEKFRERLNIDQRCLERLSYADLVDF